MVVDNNKSVPSIMSGDVGEKLFDEQSHTHTRVHLKNRFAFPFDRL